MYRVMAIANYEDRFVIPTAHREYAEDAFDVARRLRLLVRQRLLRRPVARRRLFGGKKRKTIPIKVGRLGRRDDHAVTCKALGALLAYPSADLVAALPEIGAARRARAAAAARAPGRRCARSQAELARGRPHRRAGALRRAVRPRPGDVAAPVRARARRLARPRAGDGRPQGRLRARRASCWPPGELPDFLPAVLEYLAQRPVRRGEGDARRLRAHPARGRRGAAAAAAAATPRCSRRCSLLIGEPGLAASPGEAGGAGEAARRRVASRSR